MSVPPFKVKAVFDYKSDEPDDLSFPTGQIITVTDDDDADWYTGEYDAASGEKLQGIFPRNFVEKYEPTIPTRPARAPKRAPASEPTEDVVDHPAPQPPPSQAASIIKPQEEKADSTNASVESAKEEPPSSPLAPAKAPAPVPKSPPAAAKPAGSKAPPPVAEKPSSSSFKDRIAAFNKPAAPPVSSYKPSGAGSNSNFVKKAFVAPPPSRNAYVPPPREPQPQKIYRREEDPQMQDQEPAEQKEDSSLSRAEPTEDEPKPQSLKDRIAALQKQQLEQASRNSEKKEKPKRPPKKRVDSADDVEHVPAPEPGLSKVGTNEATGPTPGDSVPDDTEPPPGPPIRRTSTAQSVIPQPQPSRELVSDTNDADDSGAGDEEDGQETSTEEERPKSKGVDRSNTGLARQKSIEPEQRDDAEEEDEEDEEEDEDPEIRRRRELRERMAKMSGGMGMMGMFGPPGGMGPPPARKQKPSAESGRLSSESHQHADTEERAPPVRIMALPGMATAAIKRPDDTNDESDQDETARPTPQETVAPGETNDYISQPLQRRSTDRAAPPTPHDRAAPPPPPRDTRAVPPPPPTASRPVPQAPQSPISRSAPPVPPTPVASYPEGENESEDDKESDIPSAPQSPLADGPTSPPLGAPPPPKRTDAPLPLDTTEKTIAPTEDKRASRPPPPVPQSPASPQTRAPPPPPPGQPPVRRSTSDSRGFAATKAPGEEESEEDEVTEYDGDYDTDIASSAKHKDALKAHNRDSSLEDGVLTDDALKSSKNAPTRAVPPLPPVAAPRDLPPPPPPSSAPKSRKSLDAPRVAPPPVPPPKLPENHDEDYDPYRYDPPPQSASRAQYTQMLQSPQEEVEEEDLYGPPSQAPSSHPPPPPPADRSAPPPPNLQPDYYPPPPPPSFAPPGQPDANKVSLDVKRSATVSRRSMDQSRATGEQGYIARDIDLGKSSGWWAQHNLPPPSLQNRTDVLYEIETSSNSKRGGKSTISKDVYVLYIDYSSTTINASFDSADPSHVVFEQNHERPPPPPRRDQLETASSQFGAQIARAANSLAGSAVADGSGHAFVLELLRPHKTALLPIGTRAYGALVYANLGNASTQQFDEIRAGDIVTFRNAKFAGHKGGLHAKYSMDVGKPDHVAVVIDWDGTKKKIRAWEQGRQEEKGKKPKVREESFKVGDLKSGEVMVWRVMPRSWVGWDKLT
ncbi:hypothetical protein PV10_07045 [Exophiala mesophila]|uniref:SH3 domain-containing protein n=1 Tax=Exophiala mesophila TaxID=212818 RepID=A0A0D1WKZ5_EXOME|nr:uncharacterized protein PV10_07045 [Exophiala mesophila]KIV89660.1 hypothetical protein PV10_07045 [Exophiala mesophila]